MRGHDSGSVLGVPGDLVSRLYVGLCVGVGLGLASRI